MKELLVIKDLECIKAIAHPRRIDILNTFDNEPLSAKQLSQILDEPHAKINYHIKSLYKVGILELVEEKIKSGIVEKYYYPKAKNIVIGKTILDFSLGSNVKKDNFCTLSFEKLSENFYNAAEEGVLYENYILNFEDISLTKSEVSDLNRAMKEKINEILDSRGDSEQTDSYNISLVTLPKVPSKLYDEKSECCV